MHKRTLKKYVPLIDVLSTLSADHQNALVPYLSDESCECLSSVIFNALSNNALDKKDRRKLKGALTSQKGKLRYIANHSKPLKTRRRKIAQLGGGLGVILSILAPLISSLFNN